MGAAAHGANVSTVDATTIGGWVGDAKASRFCGCAITFRGELHDRRTCTTAAVEVRGHKLIDRIIGVGVAHSSNREEGEKTQIHLPYPCAVVSSPPPPVQNAICVKTKYYIQQ